MHRSRTKIALRTHTDMESTDGTPILSELPEIKALRLILEKLPARFSPQHHIDFLVRSVPGCDGKNPMDLVCEGRWEELTRYVDDLRNPSWKRLASKLIQ